MLNTAFANTSSTFQLQSKYNPLFISTSSILTFDRVLPFWNTERKVGIADRPPQITLCFRYRR